MGYDTRPGGCGHTIRTYWPDSNEKTIYITASVGPSLADIINTAQKKWPGCSLNDIEISAEHIQTDCLSYDQYDSSDYTDFIVLTKSNKG